ncbi:MAG: TolC family protein [Bacteroidetes bacterium]|nr:TolC family protein [Bacteroidota bacterium]
MKSRFILFLTVFLLSSTTAVFSQTSLPDSLTLDETVKMVLERNPAIQQAAHAIEASQAGVQVSKSSLYPNADVSLNYTLLGPVAAFSFPGFGSFKLFPASNFDEHVAASGTLYDFGKRRKSIDLAKTEVQSSKDGLALVKQELTYRTIQTFYAILFLEKAIQVQNDEIKTLDQHLLITKKKVEAGTATDFDVLTTQVRVATAQDQKISLENSLENTKIALRRLLGLPAGSPIDLSGQFTETPMTFNVDSLVDVALKNRVEMKAANDRILTARAAYNVASAIYNPSLNVAVAYGFKNGYEPDINAWRGNYAVAAQVQIPISNVVPFFGGYRKENMEQEASANIRQAQSYRSEVAQQVTADVEKGISDLRSSTDKLHLTEVTVHQAESALNLARIRYEAGTVTNLDLLDAETALAQARFERLQALYNYVNGRYELQQAIGEKSW